MGEEVAVVAPAYTMPNNSVHPRTVTSEPRPKVMLWVAFNANDPSMTTTEPVGT